MKLEKVPAFVLLTCLACAGAREVASQTVRIDTDDIGGVVSGPAGPEAGVWVIAETTELPTRFARIVVTDDRGQYVIPNLPNGTYRVWVRGYGLVDGPNVQASPGKIVNLTAVPGARARRPSTIPRAIGSRCFGCPTRASSQPPVRTATPWRRVSTARPTGFGS